MINSGIASVDVCVKKNCQYAMCKVPPQLDGTTQEAGLEIDQLSVKQKPHAIHKPDDQIGFQDEFV